MHVSELSDKLKVYDSKININNSEFISIHDVEIYQKHQTVLNPFILYIIDPCMNFLKEIKELNNLNLCILLNNENANDISFRLNVNLLVLNNPPNPWQVYNEIKNILAEHSDYIRKISILNKLLFKNTGLQDILDTCSEIFGNPIIFEYPGSRIFACSLYIETNTSLENLILENYCINPFNPNINYSKRKEFERIISENYPVYIKDNKNYARLISKINIGNRTIAVLTLIEKEKLLSNYDCKLLSFLSKIISYEMKKDNYYRSLKGLTYEYLILNLIEEKINDSFEIHERVKECNWNIKENIFIFTVALIEKEQQSMNFSYNLKERLQNIISYSKSIIYNNYIVVVITTNTSTPFSKDEFSTVKALLESKKIYGGLSRCFNHLKNAKEYYTQSIKAMELGQHINKEQVIHFYEDYAVFHMLDICSRKKKLENFCHPSLMQLIKYDKSNNTKYSYSIYIYLKYDGNLNKTAGELYISTSTLSYRLSKIKELFNIDFHNRDLSIQLWLTFKILEYTGKSELYLNIIKN